MSRLHCSLLLLVGLVGMLLALIVIRVRLTSLIGVSLRGEANQALSPSRFLGAVDPDHPCGVICMAVVSHLLDKPVTLAKAKKVVDPDPIGRLSMAQVIEGLRSLGFSAVGVKITAPRVCGDIRLPLILHVADSHFVVLGPANASAGWVLNPPFPPQCERLDSLKAGWSWDGACILVARTDQELSSALKQLSVAQVHATNDI